MPRLELQIRNEAPAAYSTYETRWRSALVAEATKAKQRISGELPTGNVEVSVSVVFYLAPSVITRTDIDNLAKPLLDSLFQTASPTDPSLTGGLFQMDDSFVYKLSLTKKLVPTKEKLGADITVEWDLP